ncbi:MAG: cell division protein FtsQ/DivIB [Candidatus Tectimicrobiota bacterium]
MKLPFARRSQTGKRRRGLLRQRLTRWIEPVRTAYGWGHWGLRVGGPVVAAVGLVWVASAVGASSPLFQAAEVEVTGLRQLERDRLLRRAGLEPAPNLLALDLQEATARLLAEPWVERVKVERRLPHRLVVEVVERTAMAVVRAPGREGSTAVLVDGQGVVLRAAEAEDHLRYPALVGAQGPAPPPGSRFADPPVAAGLAVLQATEGVPLMGRGSLAVVDCTYAERIILRGRDSEAVVAVRGADLERKFARLKTLATELKRRHGSIRYIDLSFDRRVIVKGVEEGM